MIDDTAFLIEAFRHARPECKLVAIEDCGIPVTSLEVNLLTQRKREMAIVDEFVLRLLASGPVSRERVGSVLGLQSEFVIEILARLISDTVVVQERESKLLRISAFGRHVLDKDGDFFPTNHSESIYFNRVTWEIETSSIIRAISRKAALESNWIVLPSIHKGKISDEDVTLEKIRNFFGLDSTKKIEILSLQSIRQKGSAKYVFGKLLAYQNHLTGKIEPLIALDGILREDITSSLVSQKIDMAALGFPDAEETLPLDKVQLEKYNEDYISSDPIFDEIIEVAERKTSQKKTPEVLISAPIIRDVDTFEHVIYLQKALKNARSRILIISPWIKGNVVNDSFISDLEDRIKKGVRVDIVYGYKNQLVRNVDEYRGSHKHALQKLYLLMKKYPQKMEIHELNDTHAKIMLFDDVVIKTSFNWLSFKGDPKRTYRFESGTYIENPTHADEVYTQIVSRLPEMKVPEPKLF
jgi:hypothetical protein